MNKAEILNTGKAFHITGGSKDLFCQIMHLFIEHSPMQLERAKMAFKLRDMNELSASAHDIKSSASSFGGEVLYDSACKLEQYAKKRLDLELIYSMIIEVEKGIQSTIETFNTGSWASEYKEDI